MFWTGFMFALGCVAALLVSMVVIGTVVVVVTWAATGRMP